MLAKVRHISEYGIGGVFEYDERSAAGLTAGPGKIKA